jgi:hypothetical protein
VRPAAACACSDSARVARRLEPGELAELPNAGDPVPTVAVGEAWQEQTTERLVPVLQQAIDEGYGVDFRATGRAGRCG